MDRKSPALVRTRQSAICTLVVAVVFDPRHNIPAHFPDSFDQIVQQSWNIDLSDFANPRAGGIVGEGANLRICIRNDFFQLIDVLLRQIPDDFCQRAFVFAFDFVSCMKRAIYLFSFDCLIQVVETVAEEIKKLVILRLGIPEVAQQFEDGVASCKAGRTDFLRQYSGLITL